jgi:PAS domain S-box-containing protein
MHKQTFGEILSGNHRVHTIISPFKIVLPYLALGLGYIFFSDFVISLLIKDPHNLQVIQSLKGAGFIITTSVLLYFLVKKHSDILIANYETLIAKIRNSEKELRLSEEKYITLFEESPIPMWIYDKESLRFSLVNKAAVLKYGYSKDEFYSMTIKDIRPSDDLGLLYSALNDRGNEKHKVWPSVFRHIDKYGRLLYVRIESVIVPFDDSLSIMVIATDITQDLVNQENLLIANSRLVSASEMARLGYWNLEISNKKLYCSEILCMILGVSGTHHTELRTLLHLIHPGDLNMMLSKFKQLFKNGQVDDFEHRIYTPSGELKWVQQKIKIVKNRIGNWKSIEGIVYDINERKIAEEAAHKSLERYNMLSKTVFEAIIDWDYTKNEVYIGDGFSKLFGFDLSNVSKDVWLDNIYFEDKERVLQNFKASLSDVHQLEFFDEYRFVKSDGEIAFVQHKGVFDRNSEGKVIRALGAIIDITESIKKADKIKSQNLKISNMIWTQSHILRSPVASILGLVDILKNKAKYKVDDEEEVIKMLGISAEKLDEVIHSITSEANDEIHELN